MPGSGDNGTVRILVLACSARSKDTYRRYASGLYRQAFLTRGDSALAVRVVRGVIAGECALAPARGRGLVLTGGLGHVRASRLPGICPRDLAAGLRTALLRLAASSDAVAGTAEEQEKDDADTRIRHGGHHGGCRSRARGDGGQVAAGSAAVHGDKEDVTRAGRR
jgi:hypothetical protein